MQKSTEFKFKNPRRIEIGDYWYFEKYANHPKLQELTYCKDIPVNFVGGIHISFKENENHDLGGWTDFIIAFAPDKTIKICNEEDVAPDGVSVTSLLDIYLKGLRLEDSTEKELILGCDTASFEITAGEKNYHIHTLSDGHYAYATEYYLEDKLIGIVIQGWLDESAYYFDEVVRIFKYLFE